MTQEHGSEHPAGGPAGPRFLLIDDNPHDRVLAERELRREFPRSLVLSIVDPAGLDRALEDGAFDLAVTDYLLGWSDGLAVLRALKERYPLVPVVMFTDSGSEEVAVAGMKAGLDDYVLKSPKHYVRLALAVRAALERAASRQRVVQVEAALRESEDRFRTMADTAPVLIWTSGTDMLCDWFNRPWLEFTGRTMEQERGDGWAEGVHPWDYERCLHIYATSFAAREPFSMEYRLRRHDGVYRWMLDNGVPRFAPDGTFAGYIGSSVDIHEQVEQRAALEAANRAKSDFLATMSHELRTPLNAVLGYTDLLELGIVGPVTEGQRVQLARIRASAQHLIALIGEILDLARLEAGRMDVAQGRGRTTDAVAAALPLVMPQATERGIVIEDPCAEHPNTLYTGDEGRVQQILVNLLSNAVKFTEPGGHIRIACGTTERPDPEALLPGGRSWTFVRVEDTGIGIAPPDLAAVFEPFVQVESGLTRTRGGTGLGLSISRHFARLMSGDLTARSELGVGSVFTLWLPNGSPPAEAFLAELWEAGRAPEGLGRVGDAVQREIGTIVNAYVERLRTDPGVPQARHLGAADLEDHVATFLADIAQSLIALGETGGEPALLRDGSAIQRRISERHGAQRARFGWSEDSLRREFEILREELNRAVPRTAAAEDRADTDPANAVLVHFLRHAEEISLWGLRRAAAAG